MPDDSFKDYILDQLAGLGVTAKRMFGGHGLYRGTEFFGILYHGRLYFRTSDRSRADYLDRGMGPFRPNARQTLASYYEVPSDLLDDPEQLTNWARAALAATRPAKTRKPRK